MSASTATRTSRRRVGALIAAAVLVAALVLTPALSAEAVIWPKGFNPKQYMLNVLGSMLAGANPDGKLGGAKRAVIQSDQQFDHSWEGLEQQWKKSATGAPQSYEDYVIQRQEYFREKGIKGIQGQKATEQNTGKGTKYVKPMKAPATKAQQFIRKGVGIGVGVGASVGWAYRADLGGAVGGLFGVDANGAYCGSRDQFGAATSALDFITGQSCDAFAIDPEYTPNDDAAGGYSMKPVCDNGYCVNALAGQVFQRVGGASVMNGFACFATTGTPNYRIKGFYEWRGKVYDGTPGPDFFGDDACNKQHSMGLSPVYQKDETQAAQIIAEIKWLCLAPTQPSGLGANDCNATGAQPLVKQSGNPDRTFECTYTLDDGSTVTKETERFKETDKEVPSPVCPAVDTGGKAVKGVDVTEVNKDDGTKQSIYDADTTGAYQDWWQKYPECREGACSLDLTENTSRLSCFASDRMNDKCVDWIRDPDKAKNYQCWYGSHKVDLSECYVYGDVFDPQKVLDGTAYTDPTTGESVPGQSSPNASQKVLERGIVNPRDYTGCLDRGWAKANPVEWVMVPVMCSLQWAFAPSPGTAIQQGNKVENAWNDKPPGQIASAASGWKFAPTATGCRLVADLKLPLPGGGEDTAPVGIDACSGPIAQYAGMIKVGLGIVLGVLSFMACRRVAAGFAGAETTVSSS